MFNMGTKLWPPASTFASSPPSASSADRLLDALRAPVLEGNGLHRSASQTRGAVSGSSTVSTPSASATAAASAAGALIVVPSPRPFAPRSVNGDGVSRWPSRSGGRSGRRRAEVVHEGAGEQVAVLVVDDALEEGRPGPVREPAAHLALGEERVEQPAGVVDGRVVEDGDGAGLAVDLDDRDVGDEAVRGGRGDAVLVVGRRQVLGGGEGGLVEPGLEAGRKRVRVPVRDARQPPQRDRLLSPPRAPLAQLDLGRIAAELGPGDRPELRCDLERGEVDGGRAHAGEARGVVAGGDAPRARGRVHFGQDVDLGGIDAERVGDDLRADGPVALALRRRPDPHGDAAERGDDHGRALGVPRLGQRAGPLLRGLDERDVAHVRDGGLDDARDADPDQAALCPGLGLLGAALVVAGELERVVEAGFVVAGVVEPARRRPVGNVVGSDQVPPPQVDRVEAQPPGGQVHRPFERQVELRPAEAPVEPGRAAVGEDDAV